MSIAACAEIVQRGDPDRFQASMAAPPEARKVLFPLYAFNVEIARAPWVTKEALIAEMRLQWWHDVLDEIQTGKAVRSHEVTHPLADVLDAEGARLLKACVAARQWDIYTEPFEDFDAFVGHIETTSSTFTWVVARALGASAHAEDAVRNYAWGTGLGAWFRAIPELEARGRFPVYDGRPDTVRALANMGLTRIKYGRLRRDEISKGAAPALYAGALNIPAVKKAAKHPVAVAAGTVAASEFQKRLILLRVGLLGRW